ncbi:bifunctional 23S rRNA (guanine(2069)-N(7))-methyltransferase RlmK/23S rRNA (guanine(2445)-N(2))-methyltransferase RlmL [Desulfopila sp. IMCC35006]|uniref:bifunctional 23S rRNA (guanine(2069)-N(7))-methyltransferase RlmK/23S rRNA (guanine(2445)-N(2))-methyltransferase RlmL n=1 Tax=Desulfopila sp. IMCC35006 TaxID=2569542 RepID=UPI0010AD3A2D|nr:bifunctional 23S rRNA (guanine(2069)-N(7))-methyltransferase RlmK/23S rRNA (guanine(2445)-N(2))-methyltransferase RlmL [Desulfopila sp. IMCC35006]TKB26276.1 bifunctional 23S rRNA (guanine(2069)-N(7))-methyltransferase RlmK/23S rRNA (guanine(2445)-N(2))-methyltransferase RlmL [Desulfopila sp. IMCC35006]
MKEYTLIAGCASGLEGLVGEEVALFGGLEVSPSSGVVTWRGSLETGYRCCLWSRFASRVYLQLAQFPIVDEETVYQRCLEIDWQDHLTEETRFAVSCTLAGKSPITHSRYAALKVKDGLVDSIRNRTGKRPSVQTTRPEVQIHLHVDETTASLSLDLSGESLHRRGYRGSAVKAPLKETLGAAIVALSGWPADPGPLIDPMCGTGTLLIEAALMFGDSAPGLSRSYFGFLGWLGHDAELWDSLVAEALEREDKGLDKNWPLLLGYDADPVAVSAARKNIEKAGLEEHIQIKQAELATLRSPAKAGMLLSNLPYGERLSETEQVSRLYRAFGRIVKQRFPGWKTGVFISNPNLTDSFTLGWENKYKLFNGSIPCRLLIGTVSGQESDFVWSPVEPGGEEDDNEFANRLRKNLKKFLKWAARENITCFRVYDRDLPDYNLSIDLFGKWVHIHEYAPPKTIDPQLAASRMTTALKSVRDILGVRSNRIFVKSRERQKGRQQYQKKGESGKMVEVREGECSFLVNFTDYLDPGLFLDHRPIRQKIYREAKGKRFLNLYGYTGTATVHAAMGGAASTTTVDLSATYLHWAQMNLALNGLTELKNKVEKADCLQWLEESTGTYDLIFIDPPTFSNTKKDKRIFDVQKDHARLIERAMAHLDKDGLLIFSTNFRRFILEERLLSLYEIKDISQDSVPFDFSRNEKIHRCWEIRKKVQTAQGKKWPEAGL